MTRQGGAGSGGSRYWERFDQLRGALLGGGLRDQRERRRVGIGRHPASVPAARRQVGEQRAQIMQRLALASAAPALLPLRPRRRLGLRHGIPSPPRRLLGNVAAHVVDALEDEFAPVRRVQHRPDAIACNAVHGQLSVPSGGVDQVHVHELAALEAEHYPPVAGAMHAPLVCAAALQGLQSEHDVPEARHVTRRRPLPDRRRGPGG